MDPARSLMGAVPDPPRRSRMARLLRRCAREFIWPFLLLLELGHRFGRVLLQTEYRVDGGCKQRGACCHHILMEWTPLLDRYPWMGRLALWKMTRLYSFYDKGYSWEVQDGLLVRVLGCHSLRPDGRCGEYRIRPLFCRTYPEVPLTGRPHVLKGCGYRFNRRDGRQPETELVQIGRARRLALVEDGPISDSEDRAAGPVPGNAPAPAPRTDSPVAPQSPVPLPEPEADSGLDTWHETRPRSGPGSPQ